LNKWCQYDYRTDKKEVIFGFPANLKIDDMQDIADLFANKEIAQKSKVRGCRYACK
jgi:hypothetical protein